jgi:SAM-dependent methyltransferase
LSSWFAFDADFYRATYADLRSMSDEQAQTHYCDFGIAEGRIGSRFGTRQTFLDQLGPRDEVLEIGPFVSPLMTGANAKYLDILSREQLLGRALNAGLDISRLPDQIHYVGQLDDVDATFDAVISSHSVEHQPDLVHHLQQVGRVLARGGRYFMMVPDKRYCFDHFLPESTIAGVLEAHAERRQSHRFGSVIEHLALTTHDDAIRHWNSDHGEFLADDLNSRIDAAIELYNREAGNYIDVHAWYFTPSSFFDIVASLSQRKLSPLRPLAIFPTLRNTSEFFAVLVHEG